MRRQEDKVTKGQDDERQEATQDDGDKRQVGK